MTLTNGSATLFSKIAFCLGAGGTTGSAIPFLCSPPLLQSGNAGHDVDGVVSTLT